MMKLRKSFRSKENPFKKRKERKTDVEQSGAVTVENNSLDDARFMVSYNDVELDVNPKFRPSSLFVVVETKKKTTTEASASVIWEPSLKSPHSGFCVWHPPFQVPLRTSLKFDIERNKYSEADVYFVLKNVIDKKRSKKLAKSRINLADYSDAWSRTDVKLKLRPLTQKVVGCYLNLSIIRKTSPTSSVKRLFLNEDGNEVEAASITSSNPQSSPIPKSNNEDGDESDEAASIASSESSAIEPRPNPQQPQQPKSPESEVKHRLHPQRSPEKHWPHPSRSPERERHPLHPHPPKSPERENRNRFHAPQPKSPEREVRHWPHPPRSPETEVRHQPHSPERDEKIRFVDEDEVTTSPPPSLPSLEAVEDKEPLSLEINHLTKPVKSDEDEEEKKILEWSKAALKNSSRIKITNLSSSWRNGVGFCLLIHSRYPELIPLNKLENHNSDINCDLAFEAGILLGILDKPKTLNKDSVIKYLKELKIKLEGPQIRLDEKQITEWKRRRPSLFEIKESSFEETSGRDVEVPNKDLDEDKPEVVIKVRGGGERARNLIAEAHKQLEEEEEEEEEEEQEASTKVVMRKKKPKTPPTPPPPVVDTVSTSSAVDTLKALKRELSLLVKEEERITREKNELEKVLRNEINSGESSSMDDVRLQKWIQLVNEKNSLVRRQMQLNIVEKENIINVRLEAIQKRLHEIAEISDNNRTEAVRNEEQELLDKLVETVNEKNELVHHMDSQEKAIDDDERIKSFLENPNNITNLLKPEEECVIQ